MISQLLKRIFENGAGTGWEAQAPSADTKKPKAEEVIKSHPAQQVSYSFPFETLLHKITKLRTTTKPDTE